MEIAPLASGIQNAGFSAEVALLAYTVARSSGESDWIDNIFAAGFHTMRHSFAVNYIRAGGDVFRLQRILGHTTLEMTRRYVNLQTEDLQAVHDKLSLLTQRYTTQ